MSRAYRLQVRESLRQVLRADDEVTSRLEMLPILPPAQMADLLAEALEKRGFERTAGSVSRERDGIVIQIALDTLDVRVRSQAEQEIHLVAEDAATVFDDQGDVHKQQAAAKVKNELKKKLAGDAQKRSADLKKQVADRLEGVLADTRRELDQAINRATAEALKQKAAQLGRVKQVADDPETGSLTIVVEV